MASWLPDVPYGNMTRHDVKFLQNCWSFALRWGFWRLTRLFEEMKRIMHFALAMAANFFLQFNGSVAQHDVDLADRVKKVGSKRPDQDSF